jgi:hypothetical protein
MDSHCNALSALNLAAAPLALDLSRLPPRVEREMVSSSQAASTEYLVARLNRLP